MILWARLRRTEVLLVVILILAVLMHVSGYHRVWMPTVIGGGSHAVLWASFLPLGWAAAICFSYEARGAPVEDRASQRLATVDALLLVASTAAAASVLLLVGPYQHARLHLVAHVLVMTGLAVIVTVVAGAGNGIMAATALLLVTSSYSPHLHGAELVRVVEPEGDLGFSLALGLALFVGGLTLLWGRDGRRHRSGG